MAERGYRVHGLDIVTEIALNPHLRAEVDPTSAIHFRVLERAPIPAEVPEAVDAVTVANGATVSYVVETLTGWDLCYPAFLRFSISADLRSVDAVLAPDTSDEYVGIMLGGAVTALIATLHGDLVLHASAIDDGYGVVAFAGPSGYGKSTAATLVACAGHTSFADDALRIDIAGPRPIAYRGLAEARLRRGSLSLRERVPAEAPTRETVDGRLAISLARSPRDRAPLRVVVLPWPDHGAEVVRVECLGALDAFKHLHTCLRTTGWQRTQFVERDFVHVSTLASAVPVVRAYVPWGPPFTDDAGERLLDGINHALDDRR